MTKFAKISLVAAVAVAGLTTANAQPLEEAIKGVDVSGMMRYRLDTNENLANVAMPTSNRLNDQVHNYRLDVITKAKVNDMVTANVTTGIVGNDGKGTSTAVNDSASDIGAYVTVRDANFGIALPFATVIAGKQSIPGPFVDNWSDDVTRGTGAVALVPVGGITLAAGYFSNNNLDTASTLGQLDAYELAAIGSFAGVNADVWYLNVGNANKKAYSVHASTAIAGINLDGRYTNTDNSVAGDNASLGKVIASTKVAGVDVAAGYITTGKNNSADNRLSLDGDSDAQVDARVWQASMATLADAKGILVAAGMEVLPNVTAKVSYIDVECKAVNDASELLFDLGYKMSKNFAISGKYSTMEVGAVDNVATRIEAKYTF